MAELQIPLDKDGTGVQALDAGQVDTVTIVEGAKQPKGHGSRDVIRVITDGSDDVFVTFDGTDPAADGTNGARCPAGALSVLRQEIEGGKGAVVKVRSATAATYSVEID